MFERMPVLHRFPLFSQAHQDTVLRPSSTQLCLRKCALRQLRKLWPLCARGVCLRILISSRRKPSVICSPLLPGGAVVQPHMHSPAVIAPARMPHHIRHFPRPRAHFCGQNLCLHGHSKKRGVIDSGVGGQPRAHSLGERSTIANRQVVS
jgi:hypothetical protein